MPSGRGKDDRVAVVVLGDLGRSPRMQFHTLSLAEQAKLEVHIVAYGGSEPHAALLHNKAIHLHYIPVCPPQITRSLPRAVALAVKAAFQLVTLLFALLVTAPACRSMLVQCPPSIPTLAVCKCACVLKGCRLVVDWHNFGFTLLALTTGPALAPLVRASEVYEKVFGRLGDDHLCVTRAMKEELRDNWHIDAHVLYDRAPHFFHQLSPEEEHDLFTKLANELAEPMHEGDCCAAGIDGAPQASMFTRYNSKSGLVERRAGRPRLVVSSTSWTPDEDFGILLRAAEQYDEEARETEGAGEYPRILFVITGKGPLREAYRARLQAASFHKVAFRLLWLSSEDYPRLVSCADLGVSLHTSSSGFDLPMKVVDMFGCGVPALQAKYACVGELVRDDENGLLFDSAEVLAAQLRELFVARPTRLERLKRGAVLASEKRWTDEWAASAMPLFA